MTNQIQLKSKVEPLDTSVLVDMYIQVSKKEKKPEVIYTMGLIGDVLETRMSVEDFEKLIDSL